MAEWMSVPLGIDLGATRVRIAACERNRAGDMRVRAVVSRDLPQGAGDAELEAALAAAVVEDAVAELGCRERRCVFALSPAHATVRYVKFPPMSWAERLRASRFEVSRWAGFDGGGAGISVRVHPVPAEPGTYAVGAANAADLAARVALARNAGLRAIGIDHASLSLRRLLPECEAIVDVGAERTVVHAYGSLGPAALVLEPGGSLVTRGIARELSVSLEIAEKRKRIVGCAGAGMTEQDTLVAAIASAIERLRARSPIERIAVIGNGGRLPEFTDHLQSASGASVGMPVAPLFGTSPYPADVLRTAAPDWSLAVSLSSWSLAA